jgi:5-methylcytosine-specific restriction enzyme A
MSGWANSDRRQRLPDNWPSIVRRIKRRDGNQCREIMPNGVRCPEVGTDVDHVIPGDDHRDSNLRLLCEWHHQRKSSREGGQAAAKKRRKNATKFRRDEAHPGLL